MLGSSVQSEITPFVKKVFHLARAVTALFEVIICTNLNDPILEQVNALLENYNIKVIYADLSSFRSGLEALAKSTHPESKVMTLSVGINMREDQLITGWKSLNGRVKVYGWLVRGYGNDGTRPGKGWYNTAALLNKEIVALMKEGLPKYIDNGVLEKVGKHTIGGNEEVVIQIWAKHRFPDAITILNTSDPVSSNLSLGTGVTFEEKLERKIVVGDIYMKILHQDLKANIDFDSWYKSMWVLEIR